jgi:Protein of unknown function (DUF3551)
MRTILLAAVIVGAASVISTSDAKAQYYPWCSFYSEEGGTNCGFTTFGQCMANVSGIGGLCRRNPYLAYGPGDGRGVYARGNVRRRDTPLY